MEGEGQVALEIGNEAVKFIVFVISIIFLWFVLFWGDPDLLESIKNYLNSFNCVRR